MSVERKDPLGKTHLQKTEYILSTLLTVHYCPRQSTGEFRNLLRAIFSNKKIDYVKQGKIRERNQIMDDLKNIEPIRNHKLRVTEDYAFNIVDNKHSTQDYDRKHDSGLLHTKTF